MYKKLRDKLITTRIMASMFTVKILNRFGFNVASTSDYYSVLPVTSVLKQNQDRWFKPSDLAGVRYDLPQMKGLLSSLTTEYFDEYNALPTYAENQRQGYGPGYTAVDARVLYYMLRELKPERYIEVGSGLSTFYCSLANQSNSAAGSPMQITCIEPYPYPALQSIDNIQLLEDEVQNIPLSVFGQLEANDVLFIDSSHVIKIDGDVPYLFLEVLPRLKKGVVVHVHDIPFPYNVPYPPELWIFGQQWPSFWNEAMLLQAFLCYNDAYEILLSTPLLRYNEESFLLGLIPEYETVSENRNAFSSIWLRKIR